MVSKLCCGLGSLFKHQGKYCPRKTEAAPDLIEQTTWQESQHDEAEYPYEWLKSTATQKHCSGRGRRRRFLSRIRTIHALDDSGIAEDFTFNSIVANEDLSGKEHGVTRSVSEPAVCSEVTEDTNDETVKSRTMRIDNVAVENTKEQDTNTPSALKDAKVDATELSPPTSLPEQVKAQTGKGKQNTSEKDTPSSSEQHKVDVTQNKRLLENERRCADTASSPLSMLSPCSTSASAESPISNTQEDTSYDHASTADQTHHLPEQQDTEGGEKEEEQPAVAERDNVRDHVRLDFERREQRMQDWIRQNRSTARSGPRSLQLIDRTSERLNHPSQQRPNEDQSETNQSLILHNEQVANHLSTHHRAQQHLPLQLPHQHRPRNQSERREQGDRRHEREEERLLRQQHHLRTLGLAGEVATVRSNTERTRENIVRELRQQAHRPHHREGYDSMVGAIVRQRHSQHGQNDDYPDSPPNNPPPPPPPPPELERRVRPSDIERVQRLNPHPPRRRRRCQKRSVFQPKKE